MVVKYGLEVFIDNPNFIIQTFAGPLVFGLLLRQVLLYLYAPSLRSCQEISAESERRMPRV